MRKAAYWAGGAAVALGLGVYWFLPRSPAAELEQNWSMLGSYCVDCHNDVDLNGDLSLEHLTSADVIANAEIFEKVVHKLTIGLMPPRDAVQPDPAEREEFLGALVGTLDAAAAREPYAAPTQVHRLNRAEYANSIRDLLGVEANLEELLPSDGGDFGFDNIADVLTTSPMLLERYLTVALRVADYAIGNPEAVATAATYRIPVEVTQDHHLDGLPLGTRGGQRVTHYFPADAEYVFAGRLVRGVEEGLFGIEGHDIPHDFLVMVDGETVYQSQIGGRELHELSVAEGINVAQDSVDSTLTSPPIAVTAGPHEVVFTWKERSAAAQDVWEPGLRASLEAHNPSGMPRLEFGVVEGPYNVTGVSDTPTRSAIFSCRPESPAEEMPCAEEIVARFARAAYRRPVDAEDTGPPLEYYADERANGGSFDQGIHAAIARMLVSPFFLFRGEVESADVPAGSSHRVNEHELASRLSFFLWSSIPDEELLALADEGRLREPEVLEGQVRRMIADRRADALVANFTGQWLQLRNLDVKVKPDLLLFPDFDDNLRQGFRRETELLFANVLREDRPVHELISADYTFVDERLARHYGIDGVYGSRFRRVEVTDVNRRGLLGHGSLLALTSVSSRTSPIIRGKFISTELWNNPPPTPPDVVPALEESAPVGRPSTVREQLELHRASPVCASCHNNIDPIGFALENFDAVGRWRDQTPEGLEIDSAGVLGDGTSIDGPVALREALLAKPDVFAGTVTQKLMIYGLGRGLAPQDMPVVRDILRTAAEDDYRLVSIILGIVDSFPFQYRQNVSGEGDVLAAAQ